MMSDGRVKYELRKRGWTLKRIAEALGVVLPTVSRVVGGSRISPFLQEEIARLVGVPCEELFCGLYWKKRLAGLRRKARDQKKEAVA